MARKAKGSEPDLLQVAFDLVAERGWSGFSLVELAARAGMSLTEIYEVLPTRTSVLRVLARRVDEAMLSVDLSDLAEMEPRDRVFELVMRRIDALAPYKDGLRMIAREGCGDVGLMIACACNLDRATGWITDAAGVRGGPLRRRAARRIVGLVYIQTLRTWLRDETEDNARTLAELDLRLRQAEGVARMVTCRRTRSEPAAAEAAA